MPKNTYSANHKLTIRNVVASFATSGKLSLEEIHEAFPKETVFEDKVFHKNVIILKMKNPKMSFLIYRTGKIICCGAKHINDAEQSSEHLYALFKRRGLNIQKPSNPKVHNIVATADLNSEIDLERLVEKTPGKFKVIYEPEQFPGAILRFFVTPNSQTSILLFGSGKLVCTGLTNCINIKIAIDSLVDTLKRLKILILG